MFKTCLRVTIILALGSTGLWAERSPERIGPRAGSFESSFPFQANSPQIVAGPDFTTTFTFRNRSNTDCLLFVDYHQGAGQVPGIPLLTNGMDLGALFSDGIPSNGVRELVVTTPDGLNETFEGAATFEVFSASCAEAVEVITSYEVRSATGRLQELFSYAAPDPTILGTCAVAPVTYDPDGSDGRIRVPGLATVSFQPLSGVQLCTDLLDDQGSAITPQQCSDYNGGHETSLLSQPFPQQGAFTGAWRVCLEGSKPTQQVEPTAVQTLFIDVLQEGSDVQLGTRKHSIENPSCVTGPTTSCLLNNRFKVEVDWRSLTGSGPGQVARLTEDSTLFFLGADSELAVNLLNACSTNSDHFWVFYAATTDIEFDLVVTDTQTNDAQIYSNPLGQAAPPVLDTSAFATCP